MRKKRRYRHRLGGLLQIRELWGWSGLAAPMSIKDSVTFLFSFLLHATSCKYLWYKDSSHRTPSAVRCPASLLSPEPRRLPLYVRRYTSPQAEFWGILSDLKEDILKTVYTSGLAILLLRTHQKKKKKKKKKERAYIQTSIYTMQSLKNPTRVGGRLAGVAKRVGRVFGPIGEGKRIAVVHRNKFYIMQNMWSGMEEVAMEAG